MVWRAESVQAGLGWAGLACCRVKVGSSALHGTNVLLLPIAGPPKSDHAWMLVCNSGRLLARVKSKFWNSDKSPSSVTAIRVTSAVTFVMLWRVCLFPTATISHSPLLGFSACRLAGRAPVRLRPTEPAALHSSSAHTLQCVHNRLLQHGPFLRRAQSALCGSRIVTACSSPFASRFRITTSSLCPFFRFCSPTVRRPDLPTIALHLSIPPALPFLSCPLRCANR